MHKLVPSVGALRARCSDEARSGVGRIEHRRGLWRHHDRELTYFLRIARGSVREVESQLLLSRDLGYVTEDIWMTMDATAQGISKML